MRKLLSISGGTQKEVNLLNTPCVTIRNNSQWIETINEGWNILTGIDIEKTTNAITYWSPQTTRRKQIFGNGRTSDIIMEHLVKTFG